MNCGVVSEREALARARERHLQDLADARRRAVGHHHHAVGEQHRLVDVVRDHQHRGAGLADDAHQLVLQRGARERVERAERLVEQQHLGLDRERARDADALLHAAGDLVRIPVLGVRQPDEIQRIVGAPFQVVLEDAFDGQIDISKAGQPGQQRVVLEHHAAVGPGAVDVLAGEQHRARGRLEQARDQVEQRALAAARVADQRDELALADGEVDARENLRGTERHAYRFDAEVFIHS